jgi:omega-6 fatty acid desaturase (delta-12 desaturase)
MPNSTAPAPAAVVHLRASDSAGTVVFVGAVLLTTVGIAASLAPSWSAWLLGQAVLGFALLQWFAILHECGHETLFRNRRLNGVVGWLAGFFSIIPFVCWKRVHGRHHKWAGWQDVDPTTASLVPRPLSRWERVVMNVCWKWWIPLFSVLYRVNNYWHLPRLFTLFPRREDRVRLVRSTLVLVVTYATLVAVFGLGTIARVAGVALLLTLIAQDLLLLSQHTHIPQQLARGEAVRPFPAIEQEVFTRSLVLPPWLSAALLHIDAHELHHMYPFVPGYRLAGITYETENEIGAWTWIRRARAMPGEVFLFQNRIETGADI